MTGDKVLFKDWHLIGGKGGGSSHAHKTRSWYLLEVLFKITDEQSHLFHMGVFPEVKRPENAQRLV